MQPTELEKHNLSILTIIRGGPVDTSSNAKFAYEMAVSGALLAAAEEEIEFATGGVEVHGPSAFQIHLVAYSATRVIVVEPSILDMGKASGPATVEAPEVRVFARNTLTEVHLFPTHSVLAGIGDQKTDTLKAAVFYGDWRAALPWGKSVTSWQHESLRKFLPSLLRDLP